MRANRGGAILTLGFLLLSSLYLLLSFLPPSSAREAAAATMPTEEQKESGESSSSNDVYNNNNNNFNNDFGNTLNDNNRKNNGTSKETKSSLAAAAAEGSQVREMGGNNIPATTMMDIFDTYIHKKKLVKRLERLEKLVVERDDIVSYFHKHTLSHTIHTHAPLPPNFIVSPIVIYSLRYICAMAITLNLLLQ